jgi:hypothetical protein
MRKKVAGTTIKAHKLLLITAADKFGRDKANSIGGNSKWSIL